MVDRIVRFLLLSRRELLVLVLLFLASLPAITTRIYSSDEVQYFAYLRSLWFDRDVSFENEYRYFYDRNIAQTPDFHEAFLVLETPVGRRINFGTIGSAILWSPFYGVADAGVRVARMAGAGVPADGFSRPYIAAVSYASAFYGFLAVLLGIAAARRILGPAPVLPGIVVWIGTPLLFYMYVAPPFSHAPSAFAVALFVTVWLRVRGTWSVTGALALGFSGALIVMVREQDAFFLLGPAADFVMDAARSRGAVLRARVLAAIAGASAFLIGWLPQLLAYQALNGRPGPSHYVTRKMAWHSPHALQVLFDPAHGFFFWTPLAVACLIGLLILASRGPMTRAAFDAQPADVRRVAGCLLLMVALQVYVSGAVESWTVAGAFGQRRFVAVTVVLIIGLSALWQRVVGAPGTQHAASWRAWAAGAAIILCVWWNLGLTALFGTRMMDRQRIELGRNAYDVFVTLPSMAPELAWRYLAARESFYQPAPDAPGCE
ncbi:MAG: hypothetical protein H0T05_02960 [Acidobacteria bacterium]|nr:hypothetical protein [Acidobacteriota bacterium]MBA3887315.1 hypothetical protein [Acidobacteriota bacterium]